MSIFLGQFVSQYKVFLCFDSIHTAGIETPQLGRLLTSMFIGRFVFLGSTFFKPHKHCEYRNATARKQKLTWMFLGRFVSFGNTKLFFIPSLNPPPLSQPFSVTWTALYRVCSLVTFRKIVICSFCCAIKIVKRPLSLVKIQKKRASGKF